MTGRARTGAGTKGKAGSRIARADRDPKFREDPSRTRHRPDRNHRETCPN